MAWLSPIWKRRLPLSTFTLTSWGGGNKVSEISMPSQLDAFWNAIDTSANNMRVTYANGITPVTRYFWSGFNKTNKTGTLRWEALSYATASTLGNGQIFWLYFLPTSTQTSGAGTDPGGGDASVIDTFSSQMDRYAHAPQIPAQATPRTTIHMYPGETREILIGVDHVLGRSSYRVNGSLRWEEVQRILAHVLDTSGVVSTSVTVDQTAMTLVDVGFGRLAVKLRVNASTSITVSTNFTLKVDIDITRPGLASPTSNPTKIISVIGVNVNPTRY